MNKVLCHERLCLRGREFGRITGVTPAEFEEITGRVRPGWPRGEAEVLFREEEMPDHQDRDTEITEGGRRCCQAVPRRTVHDIEVRRRPLPGSSRAYVDTRLCG